MGVVHPKVSYELATFSRKALLSWRVPKALRAGGFSFAISFVFFFFYTSVKGSRSTMSHQHGTSWTEPHAPEKAVTDEHSLFWSTGLQVL
jgi:hypothetical protein